MNCPWQKLCLCNPYCMEILLCNYYHYPVCYNSSLYHCLTDSRRMNLHRRNDHGFPMHWNCTDRRSLADRTVPRRSTGRRCRTVREIRIADWIRIVRRILPEDPRCGSLSTFRGLYHRYQLTKISELRTSLKIRESSVVHSYILSNVLLRLITIDYMTLFKFCLCRPKVTLVPTSGSTNKIYCHLPSRSLKTEFDYKIGSIFK